mgnify:FL=1
MGNRVNIGKTVNYETLEVALIKAAEEVGWKARVQDKFDRNYGLGSVQETQDYSHTMVHLRGKLFPAMKVYILNKNPSDSFFLWTGLPIGFASKRRVKEYLSAVSRNLCCITAFDPVLQPTHQ